MSLKQPHGTASPQQEERESQLVERVVASFDATPDPRLKELVQALTRHVHAFTVNNEAYQNATEATVFGPFFAEGSPEIELGGDIAAGASGEPCWVEDTDGKAVPHALIEVWEADEDGFYDVQYDDGRVAARGHLL